MIELQRAIISELNLCQALDSHVCTVKVPEFLGAGARQWGFLVRGLRQMEPKLKALNIPFYMMYGHAWDNLPKLCDDVGAGLLVCDYVPVREAQSWRTNVSQASLEGC